MSLDPRVNAWRADLADERLRGQVVAPRYAAGRPARVVAGCAPVRRAPALGAEIVTYYHYGEELLCFDESGGYAWCQSLFDAYVGYVCASEVALGPSPAATHFVITLGAYAYEAPDLRTPARDFLPRHSAVVVAEPGIATRGTEYARLDTGLHLPAACLSPAPPCSPDIAAAAALYLGCPYLWGGRSFLGLDCSGLVQCAFRDLGIAVPRDTDLQREAVGTPVAIGSAAALRRCDLLYMPGHVLICAGGGAVIHADGASMVVRRDDLAALMRERSLDLADFAVRRR
ncbi:MAG TPA: NlpC/P60 family protein [Stellaceae bacterium]|nr:NlpC/P60 family protein [Stellaceae bacterium]